MFSIPQNLEELKRSNKGVIAQLLSAIEADGDNAQLLSLLDQAHDAPKGHVLGLTGPPGVGKSTLTAAMINYFRMINETVGVIAVDPSSKISGGALLGDRIRLNADPDDDGVFIRSFSNQGRLGGVSQATYAAMVLMRAYYDHVIIETVGVGQSENAITDIADTVVLCVQPGSGDSIQFMKSGIMELPHIIVITKADLGDSARSSLADVEGALELRLKNDTTQPVSVLMVSSSTGEGLKPLMLAIEEHHKWHKSAETLLSKHREQAAYWIEDVVRMKFGEEGWKCAQSIIAEAQHLPVFTRKKAIIDRLEIVSVVK